jgi:hypothetical protein
MTVNLQLKRGERTYSEEQLTAMAEKYEAEQDAIKGQEEGEVSAEILVEDVEFEIDISNIDWKIFVGARENSLEERDRKEMLSAKVEAEANLEKYGKFKLKLPKKTWNAMKWGKMKELAQKEAKGEANWVHLYLLFAQFISNHKGSDNAWATVSKKASKQKWFWLITWKDGYGRLVGGCVESDLQDAPSDVSYGRCDDYYNNDYSVPIFVL